MRILFLLISAIAFLSISTPASFAGSTLQDWKTECTAHGATHFYKGPNGKPKCDDSPAGPNDQPIGDGKADHVSLKATGDVEADFRADCAANGGQVYTAEEWNSMSGAHLKHGQLHCHKEASWSVDP